jgi:DNA-binding beta-propeller fold protein YncE
LGRFVTTLLLLGLALATPASAQSFVAFESEPVRPIATTQDGSRLLVVNTPANRLEVFDITGGSLRQLHSIAVGMEPVAVAARTNSEVWVVNHLSDSVSVVDLGSSPPRVVRTLLVGDEPRDIVFAGSSGERAFITTAHRGQNTGFNPLLQTQSVPRADVWVFDTTNLGNSMGGTALGRVELFGDTPRPLAVSPDGGSVYVGVFHSGNQTAALNEAIAPALGVPRMPPFDNVEGEPAPGVGVILKWDGATWRDAMGQDYGAAATLFHLPDWDVFKLNALLPPTLMASNAVRYAGVGTILFNITVGPTGKVYVSNTEAQNHVRFEGPGIYAATQGVPDPTTVRGHLHESRITVIDDPNITPIHLNSHINYAQLPVTPGTKDKSLALPLQMVLSADGLTLYLAAFGSSKVGIFDLAELESGTFVPDPADHIEVSGGGPGGLVLDEGANRLYVYTRFDNAISIVDLAARREIGKAALQNPEPASLVDGRKFLYDTRISSDRGDSACASCHTFGRMDDLAWNLGNPDAAVTQNSNGLVFPLSVLADPNFVNPPVLTQEEIVELMKFHPMKGPMTTQTLKGMATHGPMHWRGDRSGAATDPNLFLDADLAFKEFNVAFDGLLGGQQLTPPQMQSFTDFILQLMLPPNPIRNLDDSLTPGQQSAQNFWFNTQTDGALTCNDCHTLDPSQGAFGADGLTSFEGANQLFKVPHIRNMYQKVGKFGLLTFTLPTGNQIRGYGYLHDGSVDTLFSFVSAGAFVFPNDTMRRNMVDFMLAFPTDFKPIVGQQVTRHAGNATAVTPRIDLMKNRAGLPTPDADLVVKGVLGGAPRGWVMTAPDTFSSDRAAEGTLNGAGLLAAADAETAELTFLSVPPGSGTRVGVDADEDSVLDGDDNCRLFANLGQVDSDGDGTGDDCECADENSDGTIASTDVDAIEDCVAGLASCSALCDGDHDGLCNSGDVTAVQLALLSLGDLRCARNPTP